MRRACQYVSARVNGEQLEGKNIATDMPSILSGQRGKLNDDDMNKLLEQGFDVDNDNLPNPENVTEPTPVAINAPHVWNWKTYCIVCPRRAANIQFFFASFRYYSKVDVMKMSRLDMFLIMMPMKCIEDTVIKNKNERLGVPMTTQDYIKWVGCWLYIACWVGICNRRDWWSTAAPSRNMGAPFRLNYYMNRNRFENILSLLQHTDQASEYEDRFNIMGQWEETCNKNIEDEFSPSWVSVLDKSMMEWLNKYCPGFMCVGRKPLHFVN